MRHADKPGGATGVLCAAVARILGDRLPARTARAYRRFRHGPGAFKVDLALDGPVPWRNPAVAEAAVIGVEDEKWGERPLAAVVLAEGCAATAAELRAFLADRVPRWQLPERWSFIAEVPKTSVGKFAKTRMRDAYANGEYEIIKLA